MKRIFDAPPTVSKYKGIRDFVALIDGTNMFCRACLADYKNTEKDLSITISNFSKMLKKALKDKPKYVAIVFDSGLPTFRHKLYPLYKSNRKTSTIEDKAQKLKLIKRILHYYGFLVLDSGNFEADDIIGSLASFASKELPVVIHSEDKDFLQCIKKNVFLFKNNLLYTKQVCREKFGVEPSQFIDYLSLMGDSVDCIPGASKWGKKNASKYLAKCGNIENIRLERLSKSLLSVHSFDLSLMRKLVKIKTNIPVVETIDDLLVGDKDAVKLEAIALKHKIYIGDFYGR